MSQVLYILWQFPPCWEATINRIKTLFHDLHGFTFSRSKYRRTKTQLYLKPKLNKEKPQ